MVMENIKGSSIPRNTFFNGKHSLLPPKSPFPTINPSYLDYGPNLPIGPRGFSKPREMNSHHQRTSSESFLMEEQPSWLDELLNEPETPVRKGGHRRSSSDSFAYLDVVNASNLDYLAQRGFKVPSLGSQDFVYYKDVNRANTIGKPKNRPRESSLVLGARPNGVQSATQNSEPSSGQQTEDGVLSTATEKGEPIESGPNDPKAACDKDIPPKPSASDSDTKRAKQQFAQRSRVRKLQYIAELERTVQALQVDVSEISSEVGFLNQQNLILSMENKALKQRLDSTAQEQLIKRVEHEVLEREIGRLRSLCQQQRQPPPPAPSRHKRRGSRDLDSQFSNLSLKHHQDPAACRDPISGPLRN